MRSSATILSVAAIAGLAAASPAPQQLDFAAVLAAPTVAVGPVLNGVVDQVASFASTVAITTTATAKVTGAATSAAAGVPTGQAKKRDLQKRTYAPSAWLCQITWNLWPGCKSSTSTSSTSTSKTSSSVASATSKASSAAATTAAPSVYTPYYPALSTVTAYTTGTTTISSTSACPTTPEEGTYCGFINPEDPCAPQPDGYGPVPTPDTVSAFYNYAPFHSMASAAPTTISAAAVAVASASAVPMVYTQTFKDLNGSTQAQSYIGLYTLQTYDAAQCASFCDNTPLCTAFNLYIERDPSVAPSKNDSTAPTVWGYWCPNPASMTSYKCTLWGSNVDASTATNQGQWREDFQVVVTGSNGWDKTNVTLPATPTGNSTNGSTWSKGTSCGGKAINAPQYALGSKFFPGPYNPQVCADYAAGQNSFNKAQAVLKGLHSFTPCNMVNSAYYHKNNLPYGTYCTIFNTDISTSWATYTGGVSGGNTFSCKQSHKFTLNTVESGSC